MNYIHPRFQSLIERKIEIKMWVLRSFFQLAILRLFFFVSNKNLLFPFSCFLSNDHYRSSDAFIYCKVDIYANDT